MEKQGFVEEPKVIERSVTMMVSLEEFRRMCIEQGLTWLAEREVLCDNGDSIAIEGLTTEEVSILGKAGVKFVPWVELHLY